MGGMRTQEKRDHRPVPTPEEIRLLARSYAEAAVDRLVGLMNQTQNMTIAKAAADSLLDRGIGKPKQEVSIENVTPEERERRDLADWLAEHHPDAARELAWRQEQRALPRGEVVEGKLLELVPAPAEVGMNVPSRRATYGHAELGLSPVAPVAAEVGTNVPSRRAEVGSSPVVPVAGLPAAPTTASVAVPTTAPTTASVAVPRVTPGPTLADLIPSEGKIDTYTLPRRRRSRLT